jgi:hypothetical protein
MAQIWHRRKNRQVSVDYKQVSVVARDGIEPPTPAFSGLHSTGCMFRALERLRSLEMSSSNELRQLSFLLVFTLFQVWTANN